MSGIRSSQRPSSWWPSAFSNSAGAWRPRRKPHGFPSGARAQVIQVTSTSNVSDTAPEDYCGGEQHCRTYELIRTYSESRSRLSALVARPWLALGDMTRSLAELCLVAGGAGTHATVRDFGGIGTSNGRHRVVLTRQRPRRNACPPDRCRTLCTPGSVRPCSSLSTRPGAVRVVQKHGLIHHAVALVVH